MGEGSHQGLSGTICFMCSLKKFVVSKVFPFPHRENLGVFASQSVDHQSQGIRINMIRAEPWRERETERERKKQREWVRGGGRDARQRGKKEETNEGVGERERERQRERETERETDRETDGETDRDREKERQRRESNGRYRTQTDK